METLLQLSKKRGQASKHRYRTNLREKKKNKNPEFKHFANETLNLGQFPHTRNRMIKEGFSPLLLVTKVLYTSSVKKIKKNQTCLEENKIKNKKTPQFLAHP